MKFLDEYRDERVGAAVLAEIDRTVTRDWVLMEICGGQTHTIMRYGLDELLPPRVQLVHGPGCPVCVTPVEVVDRAIAIASRPDTTLVAYGDMLRVPGSQLDLFRARAAGADVRIVYSPMDALKIARAHRSRLVVFFAIGFETTAPAHAMAVRLARAEGLTNFLLLAAHCLVPPAIRMLLASANNRIDGLIAPGHVCAVAGCREYKELSSEFHIPVVVCGFEPLDLLAAISMLVHQLEAGRAELEIQYARCVAYDGNPHARKLLGEVFEVCDRKWRGIGTITGSGLRLRPEYAEYDAERLFPSETREIAEPGECCGAEVLRGLRKPVECPAFATRCRPETPLGALMVSGEGACAAYYRYRRSAAMETGR